MSLTKAPLDRRLSPSLRSSFPRENELDDLASSFATLSLPSAGHPSAQTGPNKGGQCKIVFGDLKDDPTLSSGSDGGAYPSQDEEKRASTHPLLILPSRSTLQEPKSGPSFSLSFKNVEHSTTKRLSSLGERASADPNIICDLPDRRPAKPQRPIQFGVGSPRSKVTVETHPRKSESEQSGPTLELRRVERSNSRGRPSAVTSNEPTLTMAPTKGDDLSDFTVISSPARSDSIPTPDSTSQAMAKQYVDDGQAPPVDISTPDPYQPDTYPTAHLLVEPSSSGSRYAPFSNGPAILEHTASLFGQTQFADIILDVYSCDDELILSIPIHSSIASVSPTIYRLLTLNSEGNGLVGSMKVVKMFVSNSQLTRPGLVSALRFIYGMAPVDSRELLDMSSDGSRDRQVQTQMEVSIGMITESLSYAVAGIILQLPMIVSTGLSLTLSILDWDTIDYVLDFAMEREYSAVPDLLPNSTAPFGGLRYEHDSLQVLESVVRFIRFNFPAEFKLWTALPDMNGYGCRFPFVRLTKENNVSRQVERLGGLRFGQMEVDQTLLPDKRSAVLSSVLISCPLPVVCSVLISGELEELLGRAKLRVLAECVVEERERRRKNLLNSMSGSKAVEEFYASGARSGFPSQKERVVDCDEYSCRFAIAVEETE